MLATDPLMPDRPVVTKGSLDLLPSIPRRFPKPILIAVPCHETFTCHHKIFR